MNSKNSKSSLFLMELILSIMFFSLAAAICVQLFVKSHVLSRNSVELNHAVVECESAIEYFIGNDGNIDNYETYYNENMELVSNIDEACYVLSFKKEFVDSESQLLTCTAVFMDLKKDSVIYEINTNYYPKEDSNEK